MNNTCHTIAFSTELNALQVDQVDKESDEQTSTYMYTQLYVHVVPSKLVTACNAHI